MRSQFPWWNQVLDKKEVSGADIKVFGYSLIADLSHARTRYWGVNLCFTAGYHPSIENNTGKQ